MNQALTKGKNGYATRLIITYKPEFHLINSFCRIIILAVLLVNSIFFPVSGQSLSENLNPLAEFLENLPLLPGNVQAGQFSSHSKHQLNADEGWYLYEDSNGDAVIFDVTGPGCIKNIWGTALDEKSVLKFYFDGELKPSLEIGAIDFFNGVSELFPKPLVSYEKRGYYGKQPFAGNSFVPVPFAKSLKICVKGSPKFYHVLYEKYPFGTNIETFTGKENRSYLLTAHNKLGCNPWNGQILSVQDTSIAVFKPNSSLSLLDYTGGGSVKSIELEADGSEDFFQNVYLRIRFENNRYYNVNAPVGFFFGSPYQPTDMRSLPLAVEKQPNGKVKLSCFFPMPFWKSGSIMLFNKTNNTQGSVKSRVTYDKKVYPEDQAGYFTTFYHKGITEYGRDWLFYESFGTGWFVGVVQASYKEHYCEGNEHFYIDDNFTPQINGTGTEDYYLACFWPNVDFNTPFAGSVGDVRILGGGNPANDYKIPGRYYRFHLDMPIPFYSRIDARIQHGARSDIESNYGSLAYVYQRYRPALYKTDYFKVTNALKDEFHKYTVTGNYKGASLDGQYEGNYLYSTIRDSGLYHLDGEIAFNIALDPANKGIRLRRRTDQKFSGQKADVYVNGNYAGTWYDPQSNHILRWYDSEFDIHSWFTENKSTVTIKLVISGKSDICNFSDFEYHVFCFV